jgi:hypothetical protein
MPSRAAIGVSLRDDNVRNSNSRCPAARRPDCPGSTLFAVVAVVAGVVVVGVAVVVIVAGAGENGRRKLAGGVFILFCCPLALPRPPLSAKMAAPYLDFQIAVCVRRKRRESEMES